MPEQRDAKVSPRALGSRGERVPAHELFDIREGTRQPGRVVLRMPVAGPAAGDDGRLVAGALGILADSALGGAVNSLRPAGTGLALTTQLRLDFVGHMPAAGDIVEARATALLPAAGSGYARGEIVDRSGRDIAFATLRGMVADLRQQKLVPVQPTEPTEAPPPAAAVHDGPSLTAGTWPRRTGLAGLGVLGVRARR